MMEPAQTSLSGNFLNLKQAAEALKVSVETLLEWNDNNILKPTITTSGEVVYTQEQISKFISIQKLSESKSDHTTSTETQRLQKNTNISSNTYQNLINNKKDISSKSIKTDKKSLKIFGVVASISVFAVIFFTAIIIAHKTRSATSGENGILSPLKEAVEINTNSEQKAGSVTLLKSSSNSEAQPLTNKNITNNIPDPNADSSDNKLAVDYLNPNNQQATEAADVNDQIPLPPVLGINSNGASSNFASRQNVSDDNSSVFDDKGNIKEDAVTQDSLATTLTAKGTGVNGTTLKQTVYPTLLTLGLLFVIFAFAAQPSFVTQNTSSVTPVQNTSQSTVQKVLEIDQKSDGSVILLFQGDEHKVSKPELNSETDQFIQRLLGYSANDKQEINYNSLKDEQLSLNAPLSKLVTRLGFVGLKRDLFFPRTSKNRVIFRRYLTHKDLLALGLTPNQISEELLN